jgi:[calcium/calmodulin-dependent protein kinase] kinase
MYEPPYIPAFSNSKQMKAVKKFKALIDKKRPEALAGALGKGVRTTHPSGGDATFDPPLQRSKSVDMDDRRNVAQALASEGVHQDVELSASPSSAAMRGELPVAMIDPSNHGARDEKSTHPHRGHKLHEDQVPRVHPPELHSESSGEKGHAHDPLEEPPLFLGIGNGVDEPLEPPQDLVAESPTAAEFSIYDTAYQEEVERIRTAQGHNATVYLTRRVDSKKQYKADANMVEAPKQADVEGRVHEGFKGLLDRAREKQNKPPGDDYVEGSPRTFSDITHLAVENTKVVGKDLGDKGSAALGNLVKQAVEKRKETLGERETDTA